VPACLPAYLPACLLAYVCGSVGRYLIRFRGEVVPTEGFG